MDKLYSINTKKQTIKLAERISKLVNKQDVILLSGQLGTGKTFFTTHLCKGLGVTETVNSPSFVLVNHYQTGKLPIYHIDLYRLNSEEDALQLGIREMCDEGLVIIEWPELLESLFDNYVIGNRHLFKLKFHFDGNKRSVTITD